jgi:hypothetical protein
MGGGGGGMFKGPKIPKQEVPAVTPPPTQVMPESPEAKAWREEQKNKTKRAILFSQGRQSTILTEGMDLGNAPVKLRTALGE